MKALTICQPYAELILRGEKRVENRKWYMGHRGPLLIHAGKSMAWMDGEDVPDPGSMAFGAIVGVVEVTECFHVVNLEWFIAQAPGRAWLWTHNHVSGPYCIVVDRPRRFATPIAWRGRLGSFNVPDDVVAAALAESGGE